MRMKIVEIERIALDAIKDAPIQEIITMLVDLRNSGDYKNVRFLMIPTECYECNSYDAVSIIGERPETALEANERRIRQNKERRNKQEMKNKALLDLNSSAKSLGYKLVPIK